MKDNLPIAPPERDPLGLPPLESPPPDGLLDPEDSRSLAVWPFELVGAGVSRTQPKFSLLQVFKFALQVLEQKVLVKVTQICTMCE